MYMDWENIKRDPYNANFVRKQEVQKQYDLVKKGSHVRIMKYFDGYKICSFQPNRFPYDLEPGLHHYIVWFHPFFFFHNTALAKQIALYNLSSGCECVVWRNDVKKRSIGAIPHYHVIFKYNSKL